MNFKKQLSPALLVTAGLLFVPSLQAYSYINTDSFGIVEGDIGKGEIAGETTTPWSLGAGYQWTMSEEMTIGLEALYLQNGSMTQNGIQVSSRGYVPFASLYYYLTPNVNIFGKVGYGFIEDKFTQNGISLSDNNWQFAGIGGVGYLIPFSKMAYFNLYADITYTPQNNDTATVFLQNAGNVLKNLQGKVGVQLMF